MKKLYKKILIIIAIMYFVFTLISQQKTLNSYKSEATNYSKQLTKANETKSELLGTKQNITSLDYIEEIAREKLDMYLPNEKVYVDADK